MREPTDEDQIDPQFLFGTYIKFALMPRLDLYPMYDPAVDFECDLVAAGFSSRYRTTVEKSCERIG